MPDITNFQANDFQVGDLNRAWLVGFYGQINTTGVALKTADGGTTWTQCGSFPGLYPYRVYFLDDSHCWVAGGTAFARTSNGGQSWEVNSAPWNYEGVLGLRFVSPTEGALITGASLYRTHDGGVTWTNLPILRPTGYNMAGAYLLDLDHAWAVSEAVDHTAVIVCTTDGGKTWTRQTSEPSCSLRAIHFADANNGCAVGSQYPAEGGCSLTTHNGGQIWTVNRNGFLGGFGHVWMASPDDVWATTSAPGVAHSLSGGAGWTNSYTAPGPSGENNPIAGSCPGNVWLVGGISSGQPTFVVRTATGGEPTTPTTLAFWTNPGSSRAGALLTTQPVVAVVDAQGRLVLDSSGPATLSIAVGTGTPGAALLGPKSASIVYGLATFDRLALDTVGVGYRLQADSVSLTPGVSEPFDIAKPFAGDADSNGTINLLDAVRILRISAGLDAFPY